MWFLIYLNTDLWNITLNGFTLLWGVRNSGIWSCSSLLPPSSNEFRAFPTLWLKNVFRTLLSSRSLPRSLQCELTREGISSDHSEYGLKGKTWSMGLASDPNESLFITLFPLRAIPSVAPPRFTVHPFHLIGLFAANLNKNHSIRERRNNRKTKINRLLVLDVEPSHFPTKPHDLIHAYYIFLEPFWPLIGTLLSRL